MLHIATSSHKKWLLSERMPINFSITGFMMHHTWQQQVETHDGENLIKIDKKIHEIRSNNAGKDWKEYNMKSHSFKELGLSNISVTKTHLNHFHDFQVISQHSTINVYVHRVNIYMISRNIEEASLHWAGKGEGKNSDLSFCWCIYSHI